VAIKQGDWQNYASAFAQGKANAGPTPQAVRDMRRAQGQARDAELKAKGYGPAKFESANRALQKNGQQLQRDANQKVADTAPKHARLTFTGVSTCFESLTWKDGILHAVFLKRDDGSGWDYEISRSEFLDMISGSAGGWFNDNLR
jgi:hypothetical protein